jgi:HEAT repeat protein
MKMPISRHLTSLAAAMAILSIARLPAAEPATPPDLTQNTAVDRKLTYNLGATGLRGWIFTKPASYIDSLQGRTTQSSRQILVTHVGAKSPADGVMQVDDVILGVNGKPFDDDARKSFARAIQVAEMESNMGVLKLTRWRAGQTEEVQLKLQVVGTYSDTAPYNCPKSTRILEEASKVLEKEPLHASWFGAVNGLALLATGKPEYLPKLRDFAHTMGPATLKLELKDGMVIWDWGYRNLFLCEYFLATGDKEVLHAINEYTVTLSKGQSMYGTFGHGISRLTPEGKLHGSIPPYGPVNMAGLPANLSIVLGKKCGVKDPEVDAAIARAAGFFGYFMDKGAIPYGEHEPWPYHENNGKNSITAVMFSLQKDQPIESRFFAKMATAGFKSRECGHTGQGFSYLWSALGANTGGPAAAAAFVKEASWHLDLVRRCDGSFTYDGGEQYGAGKTDDNTYYGNSSYDGLSPTASYVLTYAMPLKKLCITGKDANPANVLDPQEVAAAIASGHFDLERTRKSPQELVAAFSDWSPIARGWAAEELARRPEAKAMVPQLITLAGGTDVHVAQGACETLGYLNSAEALPTLVRLLSHQDRWLRYKAAQAIKKMGGTASPAIPEILTALVKTAEPLQPINWEDSIQFTHGQLASALFAGGLTHSLKDTDRKLLYPAIRVVSRNADGMARATLKGYIENQLSEADVAALAPDLVVAVKTLCPADTMFGAEIRMGAFKALTKYHYQEGIDAGIVFAKTQGGHGSESRTGQIMKEIEGYGSSARYALPQLQEVIDVLNDQCKRGEFPAGELNNRRTSAVEAAIKTIAAATTQPSLRSISPGSPRK